MALPANYRPLTVASGIHVAASRRPEKVALQEGDRDLSYGALSARITSVAKGLTASGIGRGDRIAVLAPNCLEFPELVCGIAEAGAIAVTLNPRAHPKEMSEILTDSRARVLFQHPTFDLTVAALEAPQLERTIRIDSDYQHWRESAPSDIGLPTVSEFDPFVLVYTSGTTGRAKGVLLPHRARALLFLSKAMEYGCYGADDRFLGFAPMALGAGFGFGMCAVFFGGFLEILAKFDAAVVLEKLASQRITGMFVVPSHLHAIFSLDQSVLDHFRGSASHLKAIISNAAALPRVLKEKAVDYWGEGVLHETYGFTEAGIVTNLRPVDQLRKRGSVGTAFPLCDVRLLDEHGRPVARGEVGELFVSSPYLFNGYWERPTETASCMRGRWISAGDLARVDEDGCYAIVDRKKDMVVSGGLNIYPREVEEVLLQHSAIADCAVIGVPDAQWGERLRACLVLKPNRQLSDAEATAHCRESLADYKVPRDFRLLAELPRNANGKVLKRLLKEAAEIHPAAD